MNFGRKQSENKVILQISKTVKKRIESYDFRAGDKDLVADMKLTL